MITMTTIALIAFCAALCAIADHFTGTAWYQNLGDKMTLITDDHFDVFPEDIDVDDITGLEALTEGMVGFTVLSDVDLAAIDAEIDDIPDWDAYEPSDADWADYFDAWSYGDYVLADDYEA